jgi:hypothetical protein
MFNRTSYLSLPEYGLRTYAFILPIALIAKLVSWIGASKIQLFYAMRCIFGVFSAFCETEFVCTTRGKSDHRWYVRALLLLSPGVFYLSTSYLPSAVGSSVLMLAVSKWRQQRFVQTIFLGCVAVIWTGWPFIGVLFLPLGVNMLVSTFKAGGFLKCSTLILWGIVVLTFVALTSFMIDYHYYQKK